MISKNINNKIFTEKTGIVLAISGIVCTFFSVIAFICFSSWSFSTSIDEAKVAQFGDFIGGVVGSIFSLASVILFYVALKEQRRDISINQDALNQQIYALNLQVTEFKAQKQELEETRRVYIEQTSLIREQTESQKQQVREFKIQSSIYNLQQFDTSFYSILNVLIQQKQSINKNDNLFKKLYIQLSSIEIKGRDLIKNLSIIKSKYLEIYHENEPTLLQYYKTVYRILKVVEESNIQETEKLKYVKIMFSQLSSYELLLLHYNYSTSFGNKIKPLLIKYHFFNHIPTAERIEFLPAIQILNSSKNKIAITYFINKMCDLVASNFYKWDDIENSEDINLSEIKNFLEYKATISLTIDTKLELTISFNKTDWENFVSKLEDEIKLSFNLILFDTFYLKKYKSIETSFIDEETEINSECHKLIFRINNIQIL